MHRVNVVKVWYQNDFGRTGLRDERLTRALLRDPRVGRVVHVEPPLARETLDAPEAARDPRLELARRRAVGLRDGALTLYTPTFARAEREPWTGVVERTARFLAGEGVLTGDTLLWVNAPGALGDRLLAAVGERFGRIVSEVEDDHREYLAPRSEERLAAQLRYERIVRAGDLLVSNSAAMLREWSRLQPAARLVRNAVDAAAYAATPPEPACLAGIGRPRITYAGNLRLRLQPRLFEAVARAFPDAALVLAGIGGEVLRRELPALPNLHFVGCLPPADVPALLLHSDVLVMPHATGALTDSMDPQKVFEYLASGRPVVATPVAGAREHDGAIRIAADERGFVEAVRAALAERDETAAARRRALGTARTWEDAAREAIDAALAIERPLERLRAERRAGYFQHDRPEVRRLVPESARRVLDVGCGAGAVGRALKFRRELAVTGIERDARAAARAREVLDDVREGDALERLAELPAAGFDAVLLADVLEHLAEPERALGQAARVLAPGGCVIASLPNVRHWSVLRQLLDGEFRYEPAGILDRTHLRFFTRRSARRLFDEHGFEVTHVEGSRWAEDGIPPEVAQALAGAGVGAPDLVEEAREHQWLFVARPQAAAAIAPAAARGAPAVSVIVPVCNAAGYTRQCLEELRLRGGREIETIVVDNGSGDETAEVLAARPDVQVIRNAENLGFARAVNQGLQAARAPVVCVLNNDTLLTDGWLEPLVVALARDPSIAMTGPCTSFAKGRQQVELMPAGARLESVDQLRALAAGWAGRERGRLEDASFLSGFCFVMRRAELLACGGLAEAYGRGTFEDDELCRKLRRAGRRLAIVRESYVHHFGSRTFRELGVALERQQEENGRSFVARHQDDAGLLARVAALQERWADALRLARAALRQSPRDLDAAWFAALAAARLGRGGDAARLLGRYLERCPCDPAALALASSLVADPLPETGSGWGGPTPKALPGRALELL